MNYNGRLLGLAREKLASIREKNEAEQARRTAKIHASMPEVKKIDSALRAQMVELGSLALRRGQDASSSIEALRRENLALQAERAELLAAAGYPASYTDEIYSCPRCRDTGMVGAEVCSCLQKLYNAELTRELGTLLRCGNESFERFDLTLYDTEPDPEIGESPRECMRSVYGTCLAWSRGFGEHSPNLLFQGGTGLGKTFLSACIAREVAGAGWSVAYESCGAALEAFELQKFSRDTPEGAEASARVQQYLGCDLMILDDLGTEMITSFSVAALYRLINTRLVTGKKTIISTNLGWDELERKYNEQIVSRLDGEYQLLPFVGRDIRLIRKELG